MMKKMILIITMFIATSLFADDDLICNDIQIDSILDIESIEVNNAKEFKSFINKAGIKKSDNLIDFKETNLYVKSAKSWMKKKFAKNYKNIGYTKRTLSYDMTKNELILIATHHFDCNGELILAPKATIEKVDSNATIGEIKKHLKIN
jgi:hypothetical protein